MTTQTTQTDGQGATQTDGQQTQQTQQAQQAQQTQQGQQTALTAPDTQGTQGKPNESAPAEIQIKVPEGVTLDEGMLKEFVGIAKEAKLTSEQAQKFVDLQLKMQQGQEKANRERIDKWAEEAKADKEIGGANFDKSIADAKRTLAKFGSPGFNQMLDATGLGNHKEMISMLAKVSQLIKEDTLPGSKPDVNQKPGGDDYSGIYPKMAEQLGQKP